MLRRILIATDAWHPQVNGVVRTLENTIRELIRLGHEVMVIEPSGYQRWPIPFYPEIELCYPRQGPLYRAMREFRPDTIHISTEGPIGLAVRRVCIRKNWRFTTSYHTKFPEYLHKMLKVPLTVGYMYMRWFHKPSRNLMTATQSLEIELYRRGFSNNIVRWSRGVDLSLFYPRPRTYPDRDRPILMYVGRLSKEKNLDAFLSLKNPGTKYVVGDGPYRETLQQRYPEAKFLGYLQGDELAEAFSNADVFVFPSKTDTFGLVLIEAMACGCPAAAYPVVGPRDIIENDQLGALHEDLGKAVELALRRGNRDACVQHAQKYTWENCTRQFVANLVHTHDRHHSGGRPAWSQPRKA
jgi:glycosyltransferase involved in cell wall biosynthesis